MKMLTLVQTGKIYKPLPVVIYGPDFWDEVMDFNALVKWGVIGEEDLDLFSFVETPEEAFKTLTEQLHEHYGV